MLEVLAGLPSREMDLASYSDDFDREYAGHTGVVWKLERHQTFREPGDPSWEAFAAGDWNLSMRLNDDERPAVREQVAADLARGLQVRRLRLVGHPLTSYVQWEMHYLRLLAEAGERHRVLDLRQVADRESRGGGVLPETVIIGGRVLYRLRYDDDGAPRGAYRHDDRSVVEACRDEVAEMYEMGEPLLDYFHRKVAPLPPPAM